MNFDYANEIVSQNSIDIKKPLEDIYEELCTLKYSIEDKVKFCLYLNGWSSSTRPDGLKAIEDMSLLGHYLFPTGGTLFEAIRWNVHKRNEISTMVSSKN